MADSVDTGFDPTFGGPLQKFRDALAAAGIQTRLISGVRSAEDQRELIANRDAGRAGRPLPIRSADRSHGGPDRRFGASARTGGRPRSGHSRELFENVGDGASYGLRMIGAGDPAHVELQNWQQVAQPRRRHGRPQKPRRKRGDSKSIRTCRQRMPRSQRNRAPLALCRVRPAAGAAWAARLDLAVRTWPRTGDGGDVPASMFQSLIGTGLTPQQALGVIYSHAGESSRFDLSEIGDNGNSIGWGQWNGDRRINRQAIAKGMGTTETDPSAQLAHWNKEISGPEETPRTGEISQDGRRRGETLGWAAPTRPRATSVPRSTTGSNGLRTAHSGSRSTTMARSSTRAAAAGRRWRTGRRPGRAEFHGFRQGRQLGRCIKALTAPKMDDKGNPIAGSIPLDKLADAFKPLETLLLRRSRRRSFSRLRRRVRLSRRGSRA